MSGGKVKGEGGAGFGTAFHRDAAAEGADDGIKNRKPQAVATRIAITGEICAIEALEEVRQRFRRDRVAGVAHGEQRLVLLLFQFHRDAALGACVFAGVVQQDAHRLTQLRFVALYDEVRLDVAFQRQSALKGA